MISGLVLKYLNWERFVVRQCYEIALPASSQFPLTAPTRKLMTATQAMSDIKKRWLGE